MDQTTDPIVQAVMRKLNKRSLHGQVKYGTRLDRKDLTHLQWLIHAQEEMLDAANYLEVLIQRVERLSKPDFNG